MPDKKSDWISISHLCDYPVFGDANNGGLQNPVYHLIPILTGFTNSLSYLGL